MNAMSSETEKMPFKAVTRNTKPVSLSGKPFTQPNVEAAIADIELTDEEREIKKQEEELQQKKAKIQEQKQKAEEAHKNTLMFEREKAKTAAADFRRQAGQMSDPEEKKTLYGWANEADMTVFQLEKELGIVTEDPTPVTPKQSLLSRRVMAFVQVIAVVLAIIYFHSLFGEFGQRIMASNKKLPVEQQTAPYNDVSFQKLFYEKMVVFIDLPIALLIMLLVVPFIGFYVLPIVRSKKDFYTEFYEELTPWQRAILSTTVVLGLLLFLALSHNVKP